MRSLDQPSRRDLLSTSAAAGVGLGLGPLPAVAKGSKALCLPGYNLASETGTNGYTVGIFEHATPDWNKWHDILKGFGPDLLSVYPPEAKVIREFFVKTTAVEGGDGVLAGLVFADSGLPAVQKLCGEKGPFATQGREEGWVTGKWRGNYYKGDLFRGAAKGPPPALKKGQGVVYGTHGLGIKYEEWRDLFGSADIDAFHESCGITASSAGPLIGKASSDMKAKNGVGVVHFTKAFKGAQKFEADIGGLWGTLDRKAYPNPLYVRTGEVIYSSDDFLAPPPKA